MAITDREVTLSGTRFQITPLRAWHAYRVFDVVREEFFRHSTHDTAELLKLDGSIQTMTPEEMLPIAWEVLSAIGKFEPTFVEREVMGPLFGKVKFENEVVQGLATLRGNEEDAFGDPFDVYELLGRCIAISFLGRFKSQLQKFDGLSIISPSSPAPSTPSSPDSSPPVG